jgi:PIN domain nuclease of toxin-antitoxin system
VSDVVLDASALLASLLKEEGRVVVDAYVGRAAVSAVNLTEVVSKLQERGMADAAIRSGVFAFALDVIPLDEDLAWEAGFLRRATRGLGLSLGDRACLALGLRLELPVLTTDQQWTRLDLPIPVVPIR